jgi:cytochrome P450
MVTSAALINEVLSLPLWVPLLLLPLVGILTRLTFNYFSPGVQSIPGPFWARFSDAWRMILACKGEAHLRMIELHEQYGDVVRIGPNTISVSDPAALEPILGFKNNLNKSRAVVSMMNVYKGKLIPMLISAIDGKTHSTIKRPIAQAFSQTSMGSWESVADEIITQFVRRVDEEFCGEKGSVKKPCVINDWFQFFAMDFISTITFSKAFGFLAHGYDFNGMMSSLEMMMKYIAAVSNMPWVDFLLIKNPIFLLLGNTSSPLVEFNGERIKNRALGLEKSHPERKDFLSRFFDAKEAHPNVVDDMQLAAYANTNILAASDTTAASLTSIVYHVLSNPVVLRRLQEEIDEAELTYPVSLKTAYTLPYLDAVVKEAHRMFVPGGLEQEREVGPAGLQLPTGENLPKGTVVGYSAWAAHRNKSLFGADANDFKPDRWLRKENESDEMYETRVREMQRGISTFGFGPRACLGKNIAMMEIYKLTPTFFGLFDVSVVKVLVISADKACLTG